MSDVGDLLDFSSPRAVGNYRKFLLDELENRLAIHAWECSDTDYNLTDFDCLLLRVSYEVDATLIPMSLNDM